MSLISDTEDQDKQISWCALGSQASLGLQRYFLYEPDKQQHMCWLLSGHHGFCNVTCREWEFLGAWNCHEVCLSHDMNVNIHRSQNLANTFLVSNWICCGLHIMQDLLKQITIQKKPVVWYFIEKASTEVKWSSAKTSNSAFISLQKWGRVLPKILSMRWGYKSMRFAWNHMKLSKSYCS